MSAQGLFFWLSLHFNICEWGRGLQDENLFWLTTASTPNLVHHHPPTPVFRKLEQDITQENGVTWSSRRVERLGGETLSPLNAVTDSLSRRSGLEQDPEGQHGWLPVPLHFEETIFVLY